MIGTILGNRYELLEKIGQGGMAEVYKAKCHLLNRYVSVKILKEEYSQDKEFVNKFKREATAAASLSDNNIVNIYDVGSENNINYIVMEYVNGKTLKQIVLENGKLDNSSALNIAMQIAKALECAHKNNIIHRDIKPHNILVTEEGIVKVTDFGIAKAPNSVTITNNAKIMGSAHYFSPEQAKGSFVDARTDIYSLGIVLYEMVTGKVPYDAESPVSVALKHIQEPVVPPKQLNEALSDNLNKLILKAIEKEPIKRYQSIKDMLADMQRIKSNSNYSIVTNSLEDDETRIMDAVKVNDFDEEIKQPMSKKKKRTIIISVAAVLIIAIGAVLGFFVSQGKNNHYLGTSKKETTVPAIIGLKEAEARKAVEDKKLRFVVSDTVKNDKPEGTVISMNLDEGMTVLEGAEVRVYLSSGVAASTVPNFKDMDLNSAKGLITSTGLKIGDVSERFSDAPKGTVISQKPDVDTPIDKNTKIDLVVSKGPEIKTTVVPDLKGRDIAEATAILSGLKLKIGNTTPIETNDRAQNGKIFNQSEEANKTVTEGTSINVSYYKYKEPENKGTQNNPSADNNKVIVPDFKGNTVSEAKTKASQIGLKISYDGKDNDIIAAQSIAPNVSVDKGATITLSVKPVTQ